MSGSRREYLWRKRRRRVRRIRKIIMVAVATVALFLSAAVISWAFESRKPTEETQAAPMPTITPQPTTEPQFEPDLSKPSLDWGC